MQTVLVEDVAAMHLKEKAWNNHVPVQSPLFQSVKFADHVTEMQDHLAASKALHNQSLENVFFQVFTGGSTCWSQISTLLAQNWMTSRKTLNLWMQSWHWWRRQTLCSNSCCFGEDNKSFVAKFGHGICVCCIGFVIGRAVISGITCNQGGAPRQRAGASSKEEAGWLVDSWV